MQHSSADSKPPSPHLPAISGHNGYLHPVKSQRRLSQGYPSLEMLPTGLPSGENPGFLCVPDKSLVRTAAARRTAYIPPNSFSKYHNVTLLKTWILSDVCTPSLINDGKKFPASNGSPPLFKRDEFPTRVEAFSSLILTLAPFRCQHFLQICGFIADYQSCQLLTIHSLTVKMSPLVARVARSAVVLRPLPATQRGLRTSSILRDSEPYQAKPPKQNQNQYGYTN